MSVNSCETNVAEAVAVTILICSGRQVRGKKCYRCNFLEAGLSQALMINDL